MLLLNVNCALSRKLPLWESPPEHNKQDTQHGTYGTSFAFNSTKTQPCLLSQTQYPSFNYLLKDTAWALLLPVVLRSMLGQWKAPYVPLARHLPHWDSKIRDS